jgi:hypothetical protein
MIDVRSEDMLVLHGADTDRVALVKFCNFAWSDWTAEPGLGLPTLFVNPGTPGVSVCRRE